MNKYKVEHDKVAKYLPLISQMKQMYIICSLGKEPVKITKDASRETSREFQMRFCSKK